MPENQSFIGREKELQELQQLQHKKTASLVVIYGRRRIGKSRLLQEFTKNKPHYLFSGIPPTEKTTAQDQRSHFAKKLASLTGFPPIEADDWSSIFTFLAKLTLDKPIIIVFDEISWMGSKDDSFLGKLKDAWDYEFKLNPNIIFILCGSVSYWIDKNILNSTGFMGRISLRLQLCELPIQDSARLIYQHNPHLSPHDTFKLLSIMGGIPRYLEEIRPNLSVEENIRSLCYTKSGILYNEFDDMFSDLFSARSSLYKQIILAIQQGKKDLTQICAAIKIQKGGQVSDYLEDLSKAGFISRDFTWNLKTKKTGKLSQYRLSDNYVRFYLSAIEPYSNRIEHDYFQTRSVGAIPAWNSIMGLQFENLVLANRLKILEALNISPNDAIFDNPFFQRPTTRQKGCQIDYMIQTRFDTLYICEIKFSTEKIGLGIVSEMQAKIKALSLPHRYSCLPVLIHVGGIMEDLEQENFFVKTIDFCQFLSKK